jgi:hypothetical protein
MVHRIGKLTLIIAIIVHSNTVYAVPRQYERKSIAFVNKLIYTDCRETLPHNLEESYLSIISKEIKLARFDYNPLPEAALEKFRRRIRDNRISISELESIMDQTVVPEIISYLDLKKEMRAQNLVTETQKNSFIARKAKESGITAEQMTKVMNSSFLYIPYLSRYEKKRSNNDEEKLNIEISGGLIWYHVITEPEPGIKKITTVTSTASVSQEKEGSWHAAERKAVNSAASIMALNLKTRTRELDMFKLLAPIAEVRGRHIKFPLGEREGIKLDQPYFVGEWYRNDKGKTKFHKNGFARVGEVAEDESQEPYLSSAWAIKKGDWARGMTIMEHPRLGIDFSLKTRLFPVDIEQGVFVSEEDDDFISVIFDSYSGFLPALDLDFNANIAPATGIRQSFVTFGVTGAIVPAKSKVFYKDSDFQLKIGDLTIFEIIEERENNNNFGFYVDGHIGYLKKYYLGPLALHWEAKAGLQAFSVTADYEDKVSLMNMSFGGRFNIGLEYALNIDTNIGFFAGYNAFPAVNAWIVKREDDKIAIDNYEDFSYPKISSIGKTYGFYFHYSIPSLSFNPGAVVASAM